MTDILVIWQQFTLYTRVEFMVKKKKKQVDWDHWDLPVKKMVHNKDDHKLKLNIVGGLNIITSFLQNII